MADPLNTWGLSPTIGEGPNNFGGADLWSTADNFGTGSTQAEYRTPDSVAADGIRASTPMVPQAPSEWGGFFRDTIKAVVGYGIAKDAIQSGVRANAGYPVGQYAPSQAYQPPPPISGNMLLLLLVGGGIFLATRK